jgi:hypothetical protein
VTSPITAALPARLIYDKQPHYAQGILDSEATPPLSVHDSEGAWENRMNRFLHVFTYVAGIWSSDAAWDEQDDGLVFNAQSPPTGPVSFRAGDGSVRISHDLVINSDGKISHTLWLLCILVAMFQVAARSHFGASFGDLMERLERGPEAVTSLTEFKARLINVQRYIERLRHIHDSDSVDGDVEGGGNHGSTSPPPFPHPVPWSLKRDYDTESDEFAQPASAQVESRPAITPGGTSTSNSTTGMTTYRDPFEPEVVLSRPLGSGPREPEISTRFSSIPQSSSELFPRVTLISSHPVLRATEESYQETSSSSIGACVDHTTGYAQRDRSRSAGRERPPKRVRRCSDSVVANRIDRLGRATPEFARQGQNREVVDASDEDDVRMTDDATHQVALLLARIVVGLCRDRYRPPTLSKEQRGIGMTAAELGDVLDVSVSFVRSASLYFWCVVLVVLWTLVAWTLIV